MKKWLISKVKDTDNIYAMRDFNGRVGKRRTPWEAHLRPFSETTTKCNRNGEYLLNLCAEHGLVASNTFYQHKRSQVLTWYKCNNINYCTESTTTGQKADHAKDG
uniref:Uncharacterized protein n=1 Tax=Arion vulgaris TaxID=1028688 RepID=A0A0B7AQ28_9EUPU